MASLKAALFEPALLAPEPGEILRLTQWTAWLRQAADGELVEEYRTYLERWPAMTAALVWVGRRREQAERRAIVRYLRRPAQSTALKFLATYL
jgi:hypothetical protein